MICFSKWLFENNNRFLLNVTGISPVFSFTTMRAVNWSGPMFVLFEYAARNLNVARMSPLSGVGEEAYKRICGESLVHPT